MAPGQVARWWCLCALASVTAVGSRGTHDITEEAPGPLPGLISEVEASTPESRGKEPGQRPRLTVEVYYLTTCPHCVTLMRMAVVPLVEAQLPGDLVQLIILPVMKGMSTPQECMMTGACHLALAPLCALSGTMPQPSPADSLELRNAVRFAACDIGFTAGGVDRDDSVTRHCAEKAGIDWDGEHGMQACSTGPKVFDIMYSTAYANSVISAMRRLQKAKFPLPPSMPWLFLDGELMHCRGASCNATQAPISGGKALGRPGTLLELVCAKLDPQPGACRRALDAEKAGRGGGHWDAPEDMPKEVGACENCEEVGSFRWHASRGQFQAPRILLPLALGASVFAGVCGLGAWQRLRRRRSGTCSAEAPPGLFCGSMGSSRGFAAAFAPALQSDAERSPSE